MAWFKYSEKNLPAQGLKVLCMKKGDFWVAQRFNYKGKSYWLPIPFCDSKFANTDPPDYWSYIEFHKLPGKFEGLMKIKVFDVDNLPDDNSLIHENLADKLNTIDELEKMDPQSHEEFVGHLLSTMNNSLPSIPLD